MANRKSIDEMSADELFALAQQRREAEQQQQQEAQLARIEELKEQRKQLIAEHKKALTAIDRELKRLGGKGRAASGGTNRGRGRGDATQKLLDILGEQSPLTTQQLKERLDEEGTDSKNLNQQLAYLKRKGSITSPARGVYAITG